MKTLITLAPLNTSKPLVYLDLPIDFGQGCSIARIPDSFRTGSILTGLGFPETDALQRSNAIMLATPMPDQRSQAVFDDAQQTANLLALSIWLSRPCEIAFGHRFHFDSSTQPPSLEQYGTVRSLKSLPEDAGALLETDDISRARLLFKSAMQLPRQGATWLAVYTLWLGLIEHTWHNRLLQHWIALEALFGPRDGHEISYRIAQRIALFLAADKESAISEFRQTRQDYRWRSKIVHGLQLSEVTEQVALPICSHTESVLRRSLQHLLIEDALRATFDSADREQFLDELVFNR